MRSANIADAIGNTPLVELPAFSPRPGVRLFAKLEGNNPTGSVKDRIARAMVQAALDDGTLVPGKTVLEPTSGNTGISLAMLLRRLGYPFVAVMPKSVSPERVQLLEAYGATIVYSPGEEGSNGAIVVAQKMAAGDDGYLMLFQYGNAANPLAHYETTGPEIIRDLPEVTHFVAGLGTGGTLMGVGRRLKEFNPAVEVIAAAPEPNELIQGLRSLEEGFVPPILDLSLLDRRIMIGAAESFGMTAALLAREGVFAGVSSGAVLAAALRVTEDLDQANVVCLFADGGWKYLSTGLWTRDYAELRKSVEGKVWW
ncbi:MAG: cysteine synthase family protein [Chloroflexi bacterium]|nr:cysteine synthase family protein [Chloroflexota bacterium]MCH7655744.1 cysteine synthase family protein [Chloroflexota bacterium]